MNKKLLFSVFVIINNLLSFSQSSNTKISQQDFETLTENYNKHRYNRAFKKAQIYGKAFLNKAKSKNDTSKIGESYFMLSNVTYKDTSLIYADSAIAITKKKIDFWQPAQSHLLKAMIFSIDGNYKDAFDEIAKANEYANINKNAPQEFEIKYLLSRLKTDVGDYESSIKALKEIIPRYEKSSEECENCPRSYIILSWAYANNLNFLKLPDSSETILKKLFPLSLKTKDSLMYNKLLLASAISNYQKKQYTSSLDSITKLDKLDNVRVSNIGTYARKHLYKGKIYLKLKNYDLAIKNLKKVDSIALNANYFRPFVTENYELLINYYKTKNDTKNQLFYIDRLLKADSIIDKDFAYLAKNINTKYTIPNLLLEKQKIIDSFEKNNSNTKVLVSILMFCLVLLTLVLLYNNKKRKLYKKRIEELGTRKKSQRHIINDETTKRVLDELSKIETSQLFLNKDFNLSFLAKQVDTNTSYLSKIINDYKQKTFKQYLIELRINTLLENLDKNPIMRKHSIEALAESVGYNNASSFTRIFKSYLGESPSSFFKKRYPKQ